MPVLAVSREDTGDKLVVVCHSEQTLQV